MSEPILTVEPPRTDPDMPVNRIVSMSVVFGFFILGLVSVIGVPTTPLERPAGAISISAPDQAGVPLDTI